MEWFLLSAYPVVKRITWWHLWGHCGEQDDEPDWFLIQASSVPLSPLESFLLWEWYTGGRKSWIKGLKEMMESSQRLIKEEDLSHRSIRSLAAAHFPPLLSSVHKSLLLFIQLCFPCCEVIALSLWHCWWLACKCFCFLKVRFGMTSLTRSMRSRWAWKKSRRGTFLFKHK